MGKKRRLIVVALLILPLGCVRPKRVSVADIEAVSAAVARHHDARLISHPLSPAMTQPALAAPTQPTTAAVTVVPPHAIVSIRRIDIHRDSATASYDLSDSRSKFVQSRGKAWLLRADGQWVITRHDLRP